MLLKLSDVIFHRHILDFLSQCLEQGTCPTNMNECLREGMLFVTNMSHGPIMRQDVFKKYPK